MKNDTNDRNTITEFAYAKLYDAENREYDTTSLGPSLDYGPEVRCRIKENTDNCAVTVCCITYNQENYIEETLKGFLM